MKKWYESKTLWFNILATVVLTASYLGNVNPSISAVAVGVAGVGNIILRVWFTEMPVEKVLK